MFVRHVDLEKHRGGRHDLAHRLRHALLRLRPADPAAEGCADHRPVDPAHPPGQQVRAGAGGLGPPHQGLLHRCPQDGGGPDRAAAGRLQPVLSRSLVLLGHRIPRGAGLRAD
eukprot:TRINITY_DN12198_c0_g2_i3.p2 TRINITY_DN12198_c0_g2~~TRINITY_DN12198_c0_g2_i3.p2  ORF type:complete len:127 (-),score=12.72 TRINITY_DN12198_c0_g2_i3:133-471(-)